MIRVLYFVDRLRRGGIQSLLYDMLRTADKSVLEFEVLTLDDGIHYELEERIKDLGVTVHKLQGIWLRQPIDFIKYRKAVKTFFAKHHNYDAVHLNSSSKNFLILRYARKNGIKVRIAHAHNSGFQTKNPLYTIVGNIWKPLLCKEATNLVACSEKAGLWMFGKEQAAKMQIVTNGIVSSEFAYNVAWRKDLRSSLSVADDCLLVGCVGRLVKQKNQQFLIHMAKKLKKYTQNFKIILIGAGIDEQELRDLAKKQDVLEQVEFLGFREDRNCWYSAMDIFVLPSLYEGLPVTLIEAQAAGLSALVSDTITREAKLSENVQYLPIDKPEAPEHWASVVEKMSGGHCLRKEGLFLVQKTGYDMMNTLQQLTKIYINEQVL